MTAKFSKKHYEAIADLLTKVYEYPRIQTDELNDRFVEMFEQDNPAFDSGRFLTKIHKREA